MMAAPENPSAEAERKNHRYLGNEIPWYVRAIWIAFWVFAIIYILVYQLPIIQKEIASPP
jgi:hypothetical protein